MPEAQSSGYRSSALPIVVYDQYTPIIGGDAFDGQTYRGLPMWLPPHHRRRIRAYKVLEEVYYHQDPPRPSQADMVPIRPGDPRYILGVLKDLTVGGTQTIRVTGAKEEASQEGPLSRQEHSMAAWAKRDKFLTKVQKAEEIAALYGDVFIRLRVGLSRGKKDLKVKVLEPFFVFPEYNDDEELERVTLMWEEVIVVNGYDTLNIYKDTYEFNEKGNVVETAGWYLLSTTPTWTDLKLNKYDLTADGKEINQLDLGIDFIPVFHLTNFYATSGFGESDMAWHLDLYKEINAAETDVSANSALGGNPMLVVAGLKSKASPGDKRDGGLTVGPGTVVNVDTAGGKAEYLDNSTMNEALISHADRMQARLFRNTRLGKLFSGQTDNIRDIESSKAFKTLMASLYALVAQKRTVRESFYSELLAGVAEYLARLEGKDNYPSRDITLELGSVLPMDNSDELATIANIWQSGKGFISAETAARMGKAAGTGVPDPVSESQAVLKQLQTSQKPSGFSLGNK